MNKIDQEAVCKLIRVSLWDEEAVFPDDTDWEALLAAFITHTILSLPANCLSRLNMPDDVRRRWRNQSYQTISYYYTLVQTQEELLKELAGLNVVVVKGTAAAQYYPRPEFRMMGDIDLLAKPEDFDEVAKRLLKNGFADITSPGEEQRGRHRTYQKDKILIELHHFFSSFVKENMGKVLDGILFDTITQDQAFLPGYPNGLALLEHVAQHMEEGIGLRQVIDWMMFVDKCLDDTAWERDFLPLAEQVDMVSLAKAVTRMCQMYLGLREDITWCRDADEPVCASLMEYIVNCGNFGRNRSYEESGGVSQMPSIKHPIQLFKYIQSRGAKNWTALKKHPWLKPFAWIYQGCRYVKMMFENRLGAKKIKGIFDEGEKRNEMFKAIGLK